MRKKLLSVIAAVALMASLAVPVYAAGDEADQTATITVEGTGTSFVGYRLLNATSVLKDDACHTQASDHTADCYNISYSINESYREAITTGLNAVFIFKTGDVETPLLPANLTMDHVDNNIAKMTAEQTERFADTVARFVVSSNVTPDITATDKVFSNVPHGYYLILEDEAADGDSISKAILNTNGATGLTVTLKEDGTVPTLNVWFEQTNKRYDATDAAIGQTVKMGSTFFLTNEISNAIYNDSKTSYPSYSVTFNLGSLENVELQSGTKVWLVAQKRVGTDTKTFVYDITSQATVSGSKVTTGDLFAVAASIKTNGLTETDFDTWVAEHNTFAGLLRQKGYSLTEDGVIPVSVAVTFNGKLANTAKIGLDDGNLVTVDADYPGSPYDPSVTSKTIPAVAAVYSYGVKVNMIRGTEGNYTPVPGAEYKLMQMIYPSDMNDTYADASAAVGSMLSVESNWAETGLTAEVSADGGSFTFNGLGTRYAFGNGDATAAFKGQPSGFYKLVQTKIPGGFNKAKDIIFYIDGTHNYTETDPKVPVDSAVIKAVIPQDTTFMEMAVKGTFETSVLNAAGALMPTTGGRGTTVLYVSGSVLLLLAVGFVVMKKKRAA